MDRILEPKERRRATLRKGAIAAAVTAVAVAAVAISAGRLKPSVTLASVRTSIVDRGTVTEAIEASGVAVPALETAISSPTDARVVRILRRAGDIVKAGEALVELDASDSRLSLDRLDEQIAQKRSELARTRIEQEGQLYDLRSRAEQKSVDREILEFKAQQSATLHAQGLLSEEGFRQAQAEAKKSRIETAQLQQAAENAGRTNGAKLGELQLELSILEREAAAARREVSLATARAERDGVVTWTTSTEGLAVHRGDVVARVADLTSFRIEASVSDVHAQRLRPGQRASALIGEAALAGTIASVDPTIENGVVKFAVVLEAPNDPRLRNNLRVDVLIDAGRHDGVLRVARGAFATGAARQDIFVVDGAVAVRRRATIGLIGRDYVEIVDGARAGERVIVSDMSDYGTAAELRLK